MTEKQFARMIYLSGERDTAISNTDTRLIILGESENAED
ncbi:hypothetical protein RT43_GL002046 [Enterococcus italicus DSM 15952]|nr:hypothetical protein RT43_GL002046 [Enterococcus italicus DSM 15952]